jgi:hypothetical protein
MKKNRSSLVWGIILIIFGGLGLLQHFLPETLRNAPGIWALVFGGASVIFFLVYFTSGIRNWALLFPTLIFAALAGIMSLINQGNESPMIASLMLSAVGLPFLVGYFIEKGKNWGLLIPAWIMCMLAILIGLSSQLQDELVGGGFLAAIGTPFLIVFLRDHKQWWALIPGIIMSSLAIVSVIGDSVWSGVIAVLGLGLPFIIIYLMDNNKWWALIPGGIFTTIMVTVLVGELFPANYYSSKFFHIETDTLLTGLTLFGMALTFFVLWMKRAVHQTGWAIYPAAGLGIISVLSVSLGMKENLITPVALILCGVIFLVVAIRPLKTA